jgi:hypothetical protein
VFHSQCPLFEIRPDGHNVSAPSYVWTNADTTVSTEAMFGGETGCSLGTDTFSGREEGGGEWWDLHDSRINHQQLCRDKGS